MGSQGCQTTPPRTECTDVEAFSVASDQDTFDTAYDAFRDLANDLYHIDLRRYCRGVTSEDAAGVPLLDGQEKLQVGAFTSNLAFSTPDYPT